MKRKSRKKTFDCAYDKCARLRPGQTVQLSAQEQEVLLEAIRRNAERRKEARKRQKERMGL